MAAFVACNPLVRCTEPSLSRFGLLVSLESVPLYRSRSQYDTAIKRKSGCDESTLDMTPDPRSWLRRPAADSSVMSELSGLGTPLLLNQPTPSPCITTHRGAGAEVDDPSGLTTTKV